MLTINEKKELARSLVKQNVVRFTYYTQKKKVAGEYKEFTNSNLKRYRYAFAYKILTGPNGIEYFLGIYYKGASYSGANYGDYRKYRLTNMHDLTVPNTIQSPAGGADKRLINFNNEISPITLLYTLTEEKPDIIYDTD